MVALTRIQQDQAVARQARLSAQIGELESQIASGARLSRASADPLAWAELSDNARTLGAIAASRDALGHAASRAAAADDWLGGAQNLLARVQELTVLAGGAVGDGRPAIVAELTALRAEFAAHFDAGQNSRPSALDSASPRLIPDSNGQSLRAVPLRADVAALPDGTPLLGAIDTAIAAAASGANTDIAAALTSVDAAIGHLATEQARQGIRMSALEEAQTDMANRALMLNERNSALGDTDIAEAITRLQSLAVQRDAARAMLARTTTTLFDLLR